jgi:hypothetical protein
MSAQKQNGALVRRAANHGLEPDLVCWQYAPGVCRFQTSSPEIARKLSQRSGARLVAWSVQGGYLRVFEEQIEPWRARRLVKRYLTPTNGAFPRRNSPPARRTLRRTRQERRGRK